MIALVRDRGTMARTAAQSLFCSWETVGDSRPGVIAQAASTSVDRHVVVEHHVVAGGDDAGEPAAQHLDGRGLVRLPSRRISTASLRRISSPKTSSPCWRSVVPVSTTSAMTSATPRVIAVSTAPSRRTTSALTPWSGEVLLDEARVARGHAMTRDLGDARAGAGLGGIPEGRPAEAQGHHLDGGAAGSRGAGRGR